MESKICKTCNKNKKSNEFYKNNRSKDKLSDICKDCRKIKNKEEYIKNKNVKIKCDICNIYISRYLKYDHENTYRHKIKKELYDINNLKDILINDI